MRHVRPPRPPSPPVVRRAGFFLRTRSVVPTGKVASLLTSQMTFPDDDFLHCVASGNERDFYPAPGSWAANRAVPDQPHYVLTPK